jgi:methionyl-tRNA formyltransferase
LEALIAAKYYPEYIIILKEDLHEKMNYSADMVKLAKRNKLSYVVRKKLMEEDYVYLGKIQFDFGICCGWRTFIDIERLNKNFQAGILALHDSMLPEYRGFAPLNWTILNGEKETGVTMFKINSKEIDSGMVFMQKKVAIDFDDYAVDVCQKITDETIRICKLFIAKYFRGEKIAYYKQDEKKATYTCKRLPDDGKINWQQNSLTIYNLIRALAYPYPGAFCFYNGEKYLIRKANLGPKNKIKFVGVIPGRVVSLLTDGVEVLCAKGTIIINEWENTTTHEIINPSLVIKKIASTMI